MNEQKIDPMKKIEKEPFVNVIFSSDRGVKSFKVSIDEKRNPSISNTLSKVFGFENMSKISPCQITHNGKFASTSDAIELKTGDQIKVVYPFPKDPEFYLSPKTE